MNFAALAAVLLGLVVVARPFQGRDRGPERPALYLERPRVIAAANRYLTSPPVTITAFRAVRSTGSLHDFFFFFIRQPVLWVD